MFILKNLVNPVNNYAEMKEFSETLAHAKTLPTVRLSDRAICDFELLATGAFSPLDRFMGKHDYDRVVAEMRLDDGHLLDRGFWKQVEHPELGRISVYAQGGDYHKTVKKALKALARFIIEQVPSELKVFVDTAPVMEKPIAQAAGIGWQGKHTNLVSREHGSWLFLGIILTSLDLTPDSPGNEGQHCGSCTRCLEACPTNAFIGPHRIDARRCISYLTIEHDGPIPAELRVGMGNRIYGCDDCLAVCPWNRFADAAAANRAFLPRAELAAPRLADLLKLDDAAFREMFAGSPIKRIGRNRMIRNCLIAAGNSRDPGMADAIRPHLVDADPVLVEAAQWALGQLGVRSEKMQAAGSMSPPVGRRVSTCVTFSVPEPPDG